MELALRSAWSGRTVCDTDATPTPSRAAADWPLMGDILTHRAGWPEHLIRWRRAEGADEPGRGLSRP